VGVAVDGELAADLDGQLEQVVRRIHAFWPAVDLNDDVVLAAGGEHRFGVER
jgi:hypothetical protein